MIGSASTGTGRCGQKDDSWHTRRGCPDRKQGQSRDIAGGDERGAAISDSQCKRARRRGRRRRCRPRSRRPPPPRARRRRPCRVRPGAAASALPLRGRPHPPAAASRTASPGHGPLRLTTYLPPGSTQQLADQHGGRTGDCQLEEARIEAARGPRSAGSLPLPRPDRRIEACGLGIARFGRGLLAGLVALGLPLPSSRLPRRLEVSSHARINFLVNWFLFAAASSLGSLLRLRSPPLA